MRMEKTVFPRSMQRRAVRSVILALTMAVAASYSAAESTTGTGPSTAAESAAAAGPIDIIDDIVRGSLRVTKPPRTPQLTRKTVEDLARSQARRFAAAIEAGRIQTELENHANVILREISCDLAWPVLLPDEKSAVYFSMVESGPDRLVRTYGDLVTGSTADSIKDAAYRQLSNVFGARVRNVVDLVQYGDDVREKATELFGTDEEFAAELRQQAQINGAAYTRAFVYYARVCLKPPGA